MDKKDDYKLLKKHYSEKFAQLCRDLFPTILEEPGKLYEIISNLFAPNKFLYDDLSDAELIDRFKELVYRDYNKSFEKSVETTKTPEELFDEAGYILYECKTEADIQSFRKYYKRNDGKVPVYKEGTEPEKYDGEELCTFNGDRLKRCHVFFAVKKNVDEIRREDFKNPRRQDKYGTSVLSIQFSRGGINYLSIKNRYNHTVDNPDATFSNDLDNIIPGLTDAFVKKYNFNIGSSKDEFGMKNYIHASDGRYYKYNCEVNNIYYCIDNVVIEIFTPRQYDKAKYIVLETTILDLQNKYFIGDEHFSRIIIEKIEQKINKEQGTREININDNIFITLNNQNRIVSYINPEVKEIGNRFLYFNDVLKHLELPNVRKIGDDFLASNVNLEELCLPKVEEIGCYFLYYNKILKHLELPKVKYISAHFLDHNHELTSISFPNLEIVDANFLYENEVINYVDLPNILKIGGCFLVGNNALEKISLPKVERIGSNFLCSNEKITQVELPNVVFIGSEFLHLNRVLTSISLPKAKNISSNFLYNNNALATDGCVYLPNAEQIDFGFLHYNECLTSLSLPKLKSVSNNFMCHNRFLSAIDLPNATYISYDFLRDNECLRKISLPNVKQIANRFLYYNRCLQRIELPEVEQIEDDFLKNNLLLRRIDLPKLLIAGDNFLENNKVLGYINLPQIRMIKNYFLSENRCIQKLSLPKVRDIGDYFLLENKIVHTIYFPNIEKIGRGFVYYNENPKFSFERKELKLKLGSYWPQFVKYGNKAF